MEHTLRGVWVSRDIYLDGELLSPKDSQKVWNHSPDGFNWGYGGSGPAQLSLAIMLKLYGPNKRDWPIGYQDLKWQFIANLPFDDFVTIFSISKEIVDGKEVTTVKYTEPKKGN